MRRSVRSLRSSRAACYRLECSIRRSPTSTLKRSSRAIVKGGGEGVQTKGLALVQTDNPDVRAFGNPSALLILPSKQLESLVRCSRSRRLTFGSRRHPLLVPALLLARTRSPLA